MRKIPLERLLEESRAESYAEQYQYVCGLIEEGKLMPVKRSPRNGKKPALHLSYWLVEEIPDYGQEMEELKFRTVPAIRTDYYLKHPEVYRAEAEWVRLLNRFFLEHSGEELPCVSLNERSFQIWGREKFLQREQGKTVLSHCGVEVGQLRVYDTTEPLAYYSADRRAPQTVLILENKDTFYSMRRYLMRGRAAEEGCAVQAGCTPQGERTEQAGCTPQGERAPQAGCAAREEGTSAKIFGVAVGTVIYGAGKGIFRSFEDFRFCVEPHINDPQNEILYFGDLDYEGIGIYERLAELFGGEGTGAENRRIRPFVQAYEKMVDKAGQAGMDFLPKMSENQNRSLSGLFFRCFSQEMADKMKRLLEAGNYIPQEIINITDF